MGLLTSRLLLLLGLCSVAVNAIGQRYAVTDLGSLTPTGINTWAQVVGNYNGHAYIWTKSGGMRSLGLLPAGTFSRADAINDLGWVAGTADGPGMVISHFAGIPNTSCSSLTQPFLWTPATGIQGLGTVNVWASNRFPCGIPFHGTGVNDMGEVVGFNYEMGTTYQDGFLWTKNSGMTLVIGNWDPTSIQEISNTGTVVGQVSNASEIGRAISWKNGVQTELGALGPVATDSPLNNLSLADYYSSLAAGVNDLGQMVGWSTTEPYLNCRQENEFCQIHAILWTSAGAMRDLGTLPGDAHSVANKINLFGQVIGASGKTILAVGWDNEPPLFQVMGRPFIWTEHSGMRDLNALLPRNSGWVLNTATDINMWGQIVGLGTRNGQTHGYLLTPINPFALF